MRTSDPFRGSRESARLARLRRILLVVAASTTLFHSQTSQAQIGGRTAADGPFVLEDAEDLDLNAGGVDRDWIPDFVTGIAAPLQAMDPVAAGLTLSDGQSSNGALRFTAPTSNGYVGKSFGVAMPAVSGGSTLTDPGNIADFTHLTFLACFNTVLPNQEFQIILETYPGSNYPSLHYKFTPSAGTTFQEVSVDLRVPDIVRNAGSLTISQLLSQTRYLSFYLYGGPSTAPETLVFHVDDIRLLQLTQPPPPTPADPVSFLRNYQPLRVKAQGGGYQELFCYYSSGYSYVTRYSASDAVYSYWISHDQWLAIYHYDYKAGHFTQAIYQIKLR